MKKSNVVKIVIGCIVILLIIGIISIKALTNNKQTIDIAENYLLLKQDNRYGVIDKNGSIIIEPQYEMIQIPNPEKPVFVCLFDYNNDTMEYKTKVLNDKMEQIYTTFSDINAIQIKNNTEKYSYQTQVLKYKENDKYGILSIDGKKITDAKYDEIESVAYKTNVLAVKQNDKYGVINTKGKTIVNCEYDTISADYYYNDNSKYEYAGYIVSVKTDNGYRYGYIKYDGKVLLKPEYTQIDRIPLEEEEKQIYLIAYKDGQAGLIKNKSIVLDHEYESIEYNGENNVLTIGRARKYGVTDLKGKIILPLEYDEIDVVGNCIRTTKNQENKIFDINGNEQGNVDYINIINTDSQYKVVVNSENKFAIINEKNEKIIDYNYDYIEYLFGEYFIVTSNEKVGIININNNYVVEPKYDSIQKVDNTNVVQAINAAEDIMDLYNKNLELTVSMKNSILIKEDEYIKVVSDNNMEYLNYDGDKQNNTQVLKGNNIFAYRQGEKWGFADGNGEIKVECKYEMVTEFNDKGFAGIKENGVWGIINTDGQIIVEPKYKIDSVNPDFIGEYYRVDTAYGRIYYSNEVTE